MASTRIIRGGFYWTPLSRAILSQPDTSSCYGFSEYSFLRFIHCDLYLYGKTLWFTVLGIFSVIVLGPSDGYS